MRVLRWGHGPGISELVREGGVRMEARVHNAAMQPQPRTVGSLPEGKARKRIPPELLPGKQPSCHLDFSPSGSTSGF